MLFNADIVRTITGALGKGALFAASLWAGTEERWTVPSTDTGPEAAACGSAPA